MSLLIENGTVLTGGKAMAVLPKHSVLVENGYITKIAPGARLKGFVGKRIDASGKVVMPGLINAHTHFYSTFARGLTKTRPARDFVGVLKNLWWRLDSALTTEDCYYSALIALLDAIRHGTTTLIDHHASPQAVRESLHAIEKAVRHTGLRACLCYEVSDRDGTRIAREGLEENVAFIRRCKRSGAVAAGVPPAVEGGILPPGAGREPAGATGKAMTIPPGRMPGSTAGKMPAATLSALFGLHAAFTLKDRTLEQAASMGHLLDTGFHIHVAEAQSDQTCSQRRHGKRVVERLSQFGILGPKSIAAHCVHVTHREMDLLAESQTAVVHNPQSNLNNAVGIADVLELMRRGIRIGLGTDAMTTNMLEELRVALWAQHIRARNPSAGFSEVVSALFANNPQIASRAFGLPLGELREGCVGDVVMVDYDPPTPLSNENAFGHLVFGISQATVDTTIVGGRVLMQKHRLTLDLDEARINARARELAAKLWKRL